ncbi:MAG: phosphate signaling complex protein PhoU [Microbacteriaceae bacterium]|nr:phosphate signaling complex protein PhoU [Microbacteriaceae bacterium]
MREMFDQELQSVQLRIVEIADSVFTIVTDATTALLETDVKAADRALAGAESVSEKALSLDELVIRTLALQAPVAKDLRILVSTLRISASLERMSALASHIATIARFRFPDSVIPESLSDTFDEMVRLDVRLSKKLVKLLKNTSVDLARSIQAADARVDELHREVFEVVLDKSWKEKAVHTVDVTLASRYLERIADHVVEISSKVSYLTTGEWSDTDLDD